MFCDFIILRKKTPDYAYGVPATKTGNFLLEMVKRKLAMSVLSQQNLYGLRKTI